MASLTGLLNRFWRLLPAVMLDDREWSMSDPVKLGTWLGSEYCWRCGATIGLAAVSASGCPHCRGQRIGWSRIWRLGAYCEPGSDWLVQMKFGRRSVWCYWFAEQLAVRLASVLTASDMPVLIVPVPLHWRRRWARGFDQADLLAGALVRQLRRRGVSVQLSAGLKRIRPTMAQSQLGAAARAANVRGAFAGRFSSLAGVHVIVVDDVKTTGHTLSQCVQALRPFGPARIDAAVVAVADPAGCHFTRN